MIALIFAVAVAVVVCVSKVAQNKRINNIRS